MTGPSPASMPRRRPTGHVFVQDRLLCQHAAERMREFGLTIDDVAETISGYENRYESRGKRHPGTVMVYQRGAWAVLVDETRDPMVICTIVKRIHERWER